MNSENTNLQERYPQIKLSGSNAMITYSWQDGVMSLAGVEYCVRMCKQYNIDVENIVGHCEAYEQGYGSNHVDPEHWMENFGETMDDFRAEVVKKLEKNVADKNENSNKFPYLVKITTDCLRIRKGAGTNTRIVGKITDRGVYSIIEEKAGKGASIWGRLKSKVGWISLDYTKKL